MRTNKRPRKTDNRGKSTGRNFSSHEGGPLQGKRRFEKDGPSRRSRDERKKSGSFQKRSSTSRSNDTFPGRTREEGTDFRKSRSSNYGKPFKKKYGDEQRGDRPFRNKYGDTPRGDKSFKKKYGEPRGDKPFRGKYEGEQRGDKRPSRGFDSKRNRSDKPFERRDEKKSRTFVQSKVQKQREAPSRKLEENAPAASGELIRLNKFIANSGVCSRREADELIKMGLITINGTAVTELGTKVKPTDDVRYEGKRLSAEKPVYILMNKPKGFITTTDDPQERNTVMHIIGDAVKERVYPVGRLDRNTTGLLLITNDGDVADKLTHPSYNAKKIYKVDLDRPITKNDLQSIQDGVQLEEGRAIVDDLAVVSDDRKTVGIEIHIGWNRVVRRIFEALNYQVVKLDRVVYAGLDKKDLKRGQWRFLTREEIVRLKHFK